MHTEEVGRCCNQTLTPICIIFGVKIYKCSNPEKLYEWLNWTNSKIFWRLQEFIDAPDVTRIQTIYTMTTDVLIRISCSMLTTKVNLTRETMAELLNAVSWTYYHRVREIYEKTQAELPF